MATVNNWIVTTSGEKPLSEISKQLADKGFKVDKLMNEIGCITGSADTDAIAAVRNVAGVIDVSPDMPIDIGNPGEDITW